MLFHKSQWIYADCEVCDDQYTEYVDTVPQAVGTTLLRLSCDTDYTLRINGHYVASNQYGDFEHYKIYDTIDVTPYLTERQNAIHLTVYYCGVSTHRYARAQAGVIYEFLAEDTVVAYSGTHTLSRLSPTYLSGQKRLVSSQLGFTFTYDATKETDAGYAPSVCVHKTVTFYPRPIAKLQVLPRCPIREIKKQPWGYTIDLGREVVGLCTLDFVARRDTTLTVAYGESLDDGRVRATIHNRTFSFEYRAKAGENLFTDYMLRLGCRYLEVITDARIDIRYVGILPQIYPINEIPCHVEQPLDRQIYDICLNTLRLCMMEHYVDTPWREQSLYAFDAKNQMLSGYYAFENKNRDYARANLVLLGEDRREDGLLAICSPSGKSLTIPTFSLYYILAMHEYARHTGDASLIETYAPKMCAILDAFLTRTDENGLIRKFTDTDHWNFYDWSEHLEGKIRQIDTDTPDLVLNCLVVMATDALESLYDLASLPFPYRGVADRIRRAIAKGFTTACGLLSHTPGTDAYTTLGNALAVLCGAVTGEAATAVCEAIVGARTTPSSLSMNIWKYEALLSMDTARYRDYVLDEIRRNYKKMLDAGSTTVWETIDGSRAFDNAGSLCHGWSAVPLYVFHRLGIARRCVCGDTAPHTAYHQAQHRAKESIRENH